VAALSRLDRSEGFKNYIDPGSGWRGKDRIVPRIAHILCAARRPDALSGSTARRVPTVPKEFALNRKLASPLTLAALVIFSVAPLTAQQQQSTDTPQTTTTTTSTSTSGQSSDTTNTTMSKEEMKAQRRRQKHEENAAKARAKAAKHASKAKKEQDKAMDEQEKAAQPQ
jgi:hypothetical protein